MNPILIGGIFDIGKKIIGNLFPDPAERADAELKLLAMQQSGELKDLEIRMSAIVMEAQSKDPWTSRARPSFMYVMYAMILASIPMGVLHAIDAALATSIAEGMKAWLGAIPEEMWWLFGAGYLGYATARTTEKRKLMEVLR